MNIDNIWSENTGQSLPKGAEVVTISGLHLRSFIDDICKESRDIGSAKTNAEMVLEITQLKIALKSAQAVSISSQMALAELRHSLTK